MISKKHLYLSIVLLSIYTLSAQNVRFGLKGGLNISTLTVRGINLKGDLSYKPGFHLGALINSTISKEFSIQTEFLFSNQGYNYDEGTYEMVGNINYFAIPVMVMYFPTKKFNFQAGPQVSFLMSHKAEISMKGDEFDPLDPGFSKNTTVDLKDSTQSVELGMNVGLGYKINDNVFFSGRYNFGITTVNKKESGSKASGEEDRNSVFQFSVGYLF